MDWVDAFYRHQRDLISHGGSDAIQRERLAIVAELSGPPPSSVLELGAGAGEFAVAAAAAGHNVTAIELVDVLIDDAARSVAAADLGVRVRLIHGDFYAVGLTETFDTICYWDGFGLGTDAEQHRLLARMATWLAPSGRALIDVYTPWYWAAAAGRYAARAGRRARWRRAGPSSRHMAPRRAARRSDDVRRLLAPSEDMTGGRRSRAGTSSPSSMPEAHRCPCARPTPSIHRP